jgi:preprotein translocase YajC subunit
MHFPSKSEQLGVRHMVYHVFDGLPFPKSGNKKQLADRKLRYSHEHCSELGTLKIGRRQIVLMYFHKQKKQKEHQKMISELKKGDKIIMNGGPVGTIAEVYDSEFKLEVEKATFVRVSRGMVATKVTTTAKATGKKKPTKRNKSSKTKK